MSIVVPVHDEHLTTLIRMIHSILNRTPAHLLQEIILVDDNSRKGKPIQCVKTLPLLFFINRGIERSS